MEWSGEEANCILNGTSFVFAHIVQRQCLELTLNNRMHYLSYTHAYITEKDKSEDCLIYSLH